MMFISPVVFVRCWWSCCLAAQQHPSSLVTHFILWVLHNVRLFCGKQKGANHQDFTLIVVNGAAGHRELIKFKYYTLFGLWACEKWLLRELPFRKQLKSIFIWFPCNQVTAQSYVKSHNSPNCLCCRAVNFLFSVVWEYDWRICRLCGIIIMLVL